MSSVFDIKLAVVKQEATFLIICETFANLAVIFVKKYIY